MRLFVLPILIDAPYLEQDTIKVDNGLSYFNGERNCNVYNEADAVEYVKATHKLGEIEKLFKVPQEIYDSKYGEVGATPPSK